MATASNSQISRPKQQRISWSNPLLSPTNSTMVNQLLHYLSSLNSLPQNTCLPLQAMSLPGTLTMQQPIVCTAPLETSTKIPFSQSSYTVLSLPSSNDSTPVLLHDKADSSCSAHTMQSIRQLHPSLPVTYNKAGLMKLHGWLQMRTLNNILIPPSLWQKWPGRVKNDLLWWCSGGVTNNPQSWLCKRRGHKCHQTLTPTAQQWSHQQMCSARTMNRSHQWAYNKDQEGKKRSNQRVN